MAALMVNSMPRHHHDQVPEDTSVRHSRLVPWWKRDQLSAQSSSSTSLFNFPAMDTTIPIEDEVQDAAEAKGDSLQRRQLLDLSRLPWLGWLFVYVVTLLMFLVYRWLTLESLITMYGTDKDSTPGVKAGALALGFLEDFVCATYFALLLWLFDCWKKSIRKRTTYQTNSKNHTADKCTAVVDGLATFLVSWVLFVAVMLPFIADLLFVRLRNVRFTFELVAMAISEKDNLSSAPISGKQLDQAYVNVAPAIITSVVFAVVRACASWTDLSRWNPDDTLYHCITGSSISSVCRSNRIKIYRQSMLLVLLVVAIVVTPAIVLAISCSCSSLVAYSALNTTLNELFVRALHVSSQGFAPSTADGSIDSAATYIHSATEDYELFRNDSLYRRTKGFHGDLAFDVNVSNDNPPNVLLIVVESFRFHDSHYLVGDEDPSNLFKGSNLTVTPNFDRWAKRGVAFSNMWSSWRTSRSVESLLFAQLPYDSVPNSGTSGGKADTKLSGLPQFFKAKGYEPFFTTGCRTNYDGWGPFLPSHGFDTVWNSDDMKQLAERDLGISSSQWNGKDKRGFNWGVHDDLSFELLGNLLINKTKEQSDRVANGEPKKPLFLTHYTISSHTPFKARPKWYANAKKPDFSALYVGEDYSKLVKNYLEMRYFTDVQLGKFLDRMANESILNDTIVFVVGDHGQAPEFGEDVPEARDSSATRVAGTIIAEGRLGDAVGLMIHDAVEQYDILNTLADITGVPDGGFLQDGVGRSLKRNVTFGERVVYSNNPSRKMSVVRGHQRLRYDEYSDSVLLHNADTDHDMVEDLYAVLNHSEKFDWKTLRERGRRLNAYYTKRWRGKCLVAAEC